jgi:uncharacterized protein (TIGR02453 family)
MTETISPELFEFFRELRENNEKVWFQENKERYETFVREPLLQFIAAFSVHLGEISSNFIADPRKVGGSLFRIYRDVRFSKNKTPYKTAAGVQFRHKVGKDVHAPGFYLHLEPESVFVGAGIWHPDSSSLGKIRETIVEKETEWENIFADKNFASIFKLGGKSLKKAPRGFDPDHTKIEDLKRKDFFIHTNFSEEDACKDNFIEKYADACKQTAPFMKYLTEAVGLPW